jgi:type II secretory pathway pseudopilin PulG
MRHARRLGAGFTLTDLMITMVVMAVLAALAAPSMVQFIRSSRLNAAANQFQADIQVARREAIRRNGRVLMCPVVSGTCPSTSGAWSSANWASGWLVCYDTGPTDAACDTTVSTDPNPIRVHGAVDSTITVAAVTASSGTCTTTASPLTSALYFNPNGSQGDQASPVTYYFLVKGTWTGSQSYCATIAGTGNIQFVTKPS